MIRLREYDRDMSNQAQQVEADWEERNARVFSVWDTVTVADSPYIPGGQPLPGTWTVTAECTQGFYWIENDGVDAYRISAARLDPA